MAKQLQYRRLVLLALLLGVAFAGLGYRLVDLQVLRYEELSAKARENTRREFLLEPRRGDILDAKGQPAGDECFRENGLRRPGADRQSPGGSGAGGRAVAANERERTGSALDAAPGAKRQGRDRHQPLRRAEAQSPG